MRPGNNSWLPCSHVRTHVQRHARVLMCVRSYVADVCCRLCPQTCGCDQPNSTLLMAGPGGGCSSVCRELPRYHSMLSAMPCKDAEPGSDILLAYATPLRQNYEFWGFHQEAESRYQTLAAGCAAWIQEFAERGREYACGYKRGNQVYGPAGNPPLYKLLTFICPTSCGCKAGDYGCPTSCPSI